MPKGQPGTKAPHGTISRYTAHDCRCRACKDAIVSWRREKYGYKSLEEHLADIEPEHGSESRYTSPRFKCRCEACREAANAARRERRKHPNVKVHGRAGNKNGCRCQVCRDAQNAYMREYRRRRRAAA